MDVAEALRDRPRIGLALSGGGAKSGAQVGVLQLLEELRIPVDCIAGTSVGALVGGGLVRNPPVDVVRELCADVVIAITIMDLPVFAVLKTVPFPVTLSVGATDGYGLNFWLSAGRPVDSGGILTRTPLR